MSILILPIFLYGCPSGGSKTTGFYLAGSISVQPAGSVTVKIAFYSKDCTVNHNPQGSTITDLPNFTVIGEIQKINILSQDTFQLIIPEPYESIGGILAWIDNDGDDTPDPSFEEVILADRIINGDKSIITGLDYDTASQNFFVDYENPQGAEKQYLTIIGNNSYKFDF